MKIRDLIISYLLLAIFWFFGVSALNSGWILITIIAITLPLLFLFIKNEKFYPKYTRGQQCDLICLFLAEASIFAWFAVCDAQYSTRAVAIADDIHTATQIENILFNNFELGTVRELQDFKHIVSLKTKNTDIITDAQVFIAIDKNINISKIKFVNFST